MAARTLINVTPDNLTPFDGAEVIVYAGFYVGFGTLEVTPVDDSAIVRLHTGRRGQPPVIALDEIDTVEIPSARKG